ncbi:MAG: ABC transporter ATP-binding protein [Planctomycetes bacterium]|nr:ABC transporter ATP-binding protein [Planctomycetota bacterium]
MTVPLLRTEHLAKTYADGDVHALADVNLEIQRGEFVAIMGPSGCGKSTLLNILGGLEPPSDGQVYFEGTPLSKLRDLDHFRSHHLGFVFQSFLLLPTLSALENVQVPMFEGTLSARARAHKARELLTAVGLSHRVDHLPSKLSVGERQRVAIARALANGPSLILADEPTGNLDSKNATEILELFAQLNKHRGITLVVVTHWEGLADYCSRQIHLKDGHVVSDERMTVRER